MILNLDESNLPPLRALVAILLAMAIAMLPIAMPQAAAMSTDHHAGVASHAHGASIDCHSAVDDHSCAEESGSHDLLGSACCNMSCHVFQASSAPQVHVRASSFACVTVKADEQVSGTSLTPSRRPPKAAV